MYRKQEIELLRTPLETIKQATNNFDKQNLIGEGAFGKVYKCQVRYSASHNLIDLAVKRLDVKNSHGQGRSEFLKEIKAPSEYGHENIVSLVGFCDEEGERILVYKREVNGSLDKHLADTNLTCERRLRICLNAARGLKHLHEDEGAGHRVIHRDIKSANILLDEEFKAKITDFGLSKIARGIEEGQLPAGSTDVATFGYVDPQYLMTGVLTKASNVYAFGVVLWEVLCGRPAVLQECNDERKFLSTLVECHYKHRNLEKILFANIKKDMKPYSLERITGIAYRCLSNDRGDRSTMEIVVKELQAALEHQIGKQTMLWGSTSGGDPWSFKVNKNQKLTKITIDYHTWIHAISFTKKDLDGTLHYSETNGGRRDNNAGKIFEVNFDDDEEITGISGTVGSYYGHKLVSSLCIVTTKGKYGPFGYQTRISFSKSWEVGFFGGFFGRSGWELDAIGCSLWKLTSDKCCTIL